VVVNIDFESWVTDLVNGKKSPMANVLRTPRISYVTDIEGNWHYVQHYLNRTKNIWLNEHDELELNEGVTFVFGGDAGDKGNDTLR
jgi:hypothetical protein